LRLLLRIKQRLRIPAEQKVRDDDNDGANSTAYGETPAAGSPRVFNVFAFSSSLPEHLSRNRCTAFTRVYLVPGLRCAIRDCCGERNPHSKGSNSFLSLFLCFWPVGHFPNTTDDTALTL
jgi:hypothetical protein